MAAQQLPPEQVVYYLSTCAGADPQAAIAACTEMLDHGPTDPESRTQFYVNRGNAHDALRERISALADYDHALALSPLSAQAHRNRGVTLNILEQPNDALKEFDRAIELKPDYSAAYGSRADVLRKMAMTSASKADGYALLDRAIGDYDKTLELGGLGAKAAWAYSGRGSAHYNRGQLDESLADFTKVIDLAPDFSAYLARAVVYADKRDFKNAIADVDKATKLTDDPKAAAALDQVREYIKKNRQ